MIGSQKSRPTPALNALATSISKGGVPNSTLELVRLRASQINGCSLCVEMHARDLKKAGEKDELLFTVAAWRETPYFTDAERAALALTEAATRLNDRADPVNDEVWNEATAPGADSAVLVWHWAAGLVREGIEASLERLGVHFDVWTTEASLHEAGWVERAVERLR